MLKQNLLLLKHALYCGAFALFITNAASAQEFSMKALSAEPSKPSVYESTFTTTSALSPEAEFVFDFPAEFDLSQLQIAGSPEINGGFTLMRDKQKVLVKRSGLGRSVAPGTLVRLRLGAIVNPKSFSSSGEVALQVRPATDRAVTTFAKQRVTFESKKQLAREN